MKEFEKNSLYKSLEPVRRNRSGSLYPLTAGQCRSIGKLIRHECCNYVDGRCIVLDCDCCPQMISLHILCRWFQNCVLPLVPVLEAEIFHDRKMKKCAVCGASFIVSSPRSKYCPKCSVSIRRRKNAGYQRALRERKHHRSVSILSPEKPVIMGFTEAD